MTSRGERLALLGVMLLAAALRLPALDRIPNGLIPDEALSGYDAYSIARTGRDAYGERLPLFPRSTARLHSLYIYLTVPFVAALGLDEWAVRLPSALAGIATAFVLFAWLREGFGATAGLLGAALLAVSPWHILLSRTGHDWNLVPLMAVLTVWLCSRALAGRAPFWLAGLAAGLSLYTYTPIRLWLPLLLLLIVATHWQELRRRPRGALVFGVVLAALAAPPLAALLLTREGIGRLSSVAAGGAGPSDAALGFASRYARSFGPSFLLAPATEPELHRLRAVGLLHPFEAALASVGIAACLLRRERRALLPLLLVVAAPLAFALHRDAPDPILAVVMLPWPQALAGIGGAWLIECSAALSAPLRAGLAAAALVCVSIPLARMGRDLFRQFPVYAAPAWGYGAREAIRTLEARRAPGDVVRVDVGEKLIGSLILFYTRLEPRVRHAEIGGLVGRSERSRAGAYWIGALPETRGAGSLVWTTRAGASRLGSAARELESVRLPDGRERYVLLALDPEARER